MKNRPNLALAISIFVLIGVPLIFLIVSMRTDNWLFLLYSLPPSFLAGYSGVVLSIRAMKNGKG